MTDSHAPTDVVTRFAPSPTGYLHIGGARTALFNWLFTRRHGGRFLIRVEDTDRERSTEAAVKAIFDGLDWLGLTADAPPVFQHARADRHREVVDTLVEKGHAYRDWTSTEETGRLRDEARAEKRTFVSPWRDRDPAEGDLNQPHVVRFRRPLDTRVTLDDAVQGPVNWRAEDLDDLVLLRSDGNPTYNLAVVADDHDMGVTHIIRGDDHLNNGARQALIYDALGWTRPVFAHIPLIHGPDGAKLSKRHGAQAVHEYADMGYLPEAMRNYLARLGWAHGDDELFNDAQAIEWFDLSGINKAPARLDFAKLAHVNAHWIRQADVARLVDLVAQSQAEKAALARVIPHIQDRATTLIELREQAGFALASRPITLSEKAAGQLTPEATERLARLIPVLRDQTDWTVDALDSTLKSFAESEGVGFGKIGPAVRAALTGGAASPDIASTLASLSREDALGRLDDALQHTK
ncbi:glutamate--tRNA ligase [Brevundimonas halotolerans]|uniref:Glutamate--tRNA ligase n=1 Tax=Brevundimonas halotolerans TaxID=69670 RepID=A0A7W9A1Y7_9CAUL|nr:glutamate--tRNA ligase [Brevundimonas halotolerans]MBB5659743.1 glutamyl-tRNA synthetase [Brevundimonas halotolerans]